MKNLQPIKILALSFLLVIVSFVFSHHASAQEVYYYKCADGGSISTTINITKKIFYPSDSPSSLQFQATSQLYSTCSKTSVNVKATNNDSLNNTEKIVIESYALMPLETYPTSLAKQDFTAPKKSGKYTVGFQTGVEPLCSSNSKEKFAGKNAYHMYPEMMIDTGQSTGLVTLAFNAIEVPNRFTVWSFTGNKLIAASGIPNDKINSANIRYNPQTNMGDGSDGWIGFARYTGPWNRNPQDVNDDNPFNKMSQSGYSGTMTFTPIPGQNLYRVRVETSTGPGQSDIRKYPGSDDDDDYFIEAKCS